MWSKTIFNKQQTKLNLDKNNGNTASNSRIPILKNNDASTIEQSQINVNNLPKTNTINRYASLDDDDEFDSTDSVDESGKNNNNEPKSPFVADVNGMIKTLTYLIPSSEFYYNSLRDGQSNMLKTESL